MEPNYMDIHFSGYYSAYDNLSELNNDSTAWSLLYYIGLILCERKDY